MDGNGIIGTGAADSAARSFAEAGAGVMDAAGIASGASDALGVGVDVGGIVSGKAAGGASAIAGVAGAIAKGIAGIAKKLQEIIRKMLEEAMAEERSADGQGKDSGSSGKGAEDPEAGQDGTETDGAAVPMTLGGRIGAILKSVADRIGAAAKDGGEATARGASEASAMMFLVPGALPGFDPYGRDFEWPEGGAGPDGGMPGWSWKDSGKPAEKEQDRGPAVRAARIGIYLPDSGKDGEEAGYDGP